MIYLKLQSDKSLKSNQSACIYEGENLADSIKINIPNAYLDYQCFLNILASDENMGDEFLIENDVEYPIDNKFLAVEQELIIWIEMRKGEILAKSSEVKVIVNKHHKVESIITDIEISAFEQLMQEVSELYQETINVKIEIESLITEIENTLNIEEINKKLAELNILKEELEKNLEKLESIPTKISQLENDIGFITSTEIQDINDALNLKAPLANPAFTGFVTIDGDAAATKSYVDGLIANLNSGVPDIVDSTHPLPTTYKAGMSWRVAEAGTYIGEVCEPGDLIIALVSRTEEGTSTNNDFMIIQANINGAVTGPATAINNNLVVFDGITGKIIKDSSVTIESVNNVLAKVNRLHIDALETYDKNQTTLITEANNYTDTAKAEIQDKIDVVDDKFNNYYTSKAIDEKLTPITEELNTKASTTELSAAVVNLQAEIDSDVSASKVEITNEYKDYIQNRIGEGIDENVTIKSYIDAAVGSSEISSAEAIAAAKVEAIATAKIYTDNAIGDALEERY